MFTIIPQSVTKKINSFAEHLQTKQDITTRGGGGGGGGGVVSHLLSLADIC
jgi:hypothetical protein